MFIDKNTNDLLIISRLFITPIDDVSSFSDGTDRFRKTITFKTGKAWKEIYLSPGITQFSEKEKEEEAGTLVEQTLKFSFPGEDSDTGSLIEEIERRQLIVLMSIDGSTPKVFGCLENGARLKRLTQISPKGSTTECEITCTAQQFSWWLQTGAPPL
ncbi:MAG: hypothetical protein D4R67_12000 [Bacteroidetes bacterium]|nr:MAG: hypothetical protein D4R67_12000 [Bacteroidota bacterium]